MTYVLPGKHGSGEVCMNGGAALHAKVGDLVHVLAFCRMSEEEADQYHPTLVFTEGENELASIEQYEYYNRVINPPNPMELPAFQRA